MHFHSLRFGGKFNCTVSDKLDLRATGAQGGTVCIQTRPAVPLPLWLRVYARAGAWMCNDVELCGTTCVRYPVGFRSGSMLFSSSLVNFATWTLELPYCPSIPLEHVIGMRAVHVVL